MDYITRSAEDIILADAQEYKVIMISGARQVGKSTLVSKLFDEIPLISMDDPFVEGQAKNDPGVFLNLYEPPVVIDEIQRVPELFRHIKLIADKSDEKGRFVLTGSSPFKLMELASESLAGRFSVIELSAMSLREILGSDFNTPFIPTLDYIRDRLSSGVSSANIWKLIHRGGYPVLAVSDQNWERYFANYVNTYIERDVRQLAAVQDYDAFRRFLVACAVRTGTLLNYSAIASEIGRDADTVKKWISVLEMSGLVFLLEPYSASSLKRVVRTPKLYFRDTGLAAYLSRWLSPETLAAGALSGAFFETFVISEIIKSYSNRGLDYRHYVSYYRGRDKGSADNEIDLIIERDGVLYPIEIKMTGNPKSDMTSAFTVLDRIEEKKRGMGAVICMCSQPVSLRDNIMAIPVWCI